MEPKKPCPKEVLFSDWRMLRYRLRGGRLATTDQSGVGSAGLEIQPIEPAIEIPQPKTEESPPVNVSENESPKEGDMAGKAPKRRKKRISGEA